MFPFFKRSNKVESMIIRSVDFANKSFEVSEKDCYEFLKKYHSICDSNGFKSHILNFSRTTDDYLKMLSSFKDYIEGVLRDYSIDDACDKLCLKTTSLIKLANELMMYMGESDNPFCKFIRQTELFEDFNNTNPITLYQEFSGHEIDIPDELFYIFFMIMYHRLFIVINLKYKINNDLLSR